MIYPEGLRRRTCIVLEFRGSADFLIGANRGNSINIALASFPKSRLIILPTFGGFMATSATRQAQLQTFIYFKEEREKEHRIDKDQAGHFRQKLDKPLPLSSNPALQMQLDKVYAAYQKIIRDILNIYHEIDDISQNRLAFLDHIIDHMRISQTNDDLGSAFETFRSQLEPLRAQSLQLQRKLQSKEAAMLIILAEADESLPIETNEPLLVYPEGLRRRTCRRLEV